MKQLTREQIAELSVTLAPYGLVVKTAPKAKLEGEGSPGKRPIWWHGNGSAKTRQMVRLYGYSNERYGFV